MARSLLALVVLAAAGLIGWRVLAPAEVLSPAAMPYASPVAHRAGVTGRTTVAPLIVDDTIRVYASPRQVRADAPVGARTVYTAIWSLRRWPSRLSGVVALGATVVTRWSDGALIAVDGRTGRIAWRSSFPAFPGSATVWSPPGLHVAAGAVLVSGAGHLAAYDGTTGSRRWTVAVTCADGFTTAGGRYVCPAGAYDTATGAPVADWPAGPFTPLGCDVSASACAGLRDAAGRGWLLDGPAPRRATALDRPGSTTAAGLVLYPSDGALIATDASGTVRYRFPLAQVLGAAGDRLALLKPNRDLLVVNPRTGSTLADFPLAIGSESLTWNPGGWQVTPAWVAIERLTPAGTPFNTERFILAAI